MGAGASGTMYKATLEPCRTPLIGDLACRPSASLEVDSVPSIRPSSSVHSCTESLLPGLPASGSASTCWPSCLKGPSRDRVPCSPSRTNRRVTFDFKVAFWFPGPDQICLPASFFPQGSSCQSFSLHAAPSMSEVEHQSLRRATGLATSSGEALGCSHIPFCSSLHE